MPNNRLIYLDHSSIITLERTLKRDRKTFDAFVRDWHDHGCVLALSTVHIMEIARSQHADSRTARAKVLHQLGPARTDFITNPKAAGTLRDLTGREVLAVMGVLFGRSEELAPIEWNRLAFPSTISQDQLPAALRVMLSREIRRMVGQVHAAFQQEARAFDAAGKVKAKRLRDLPSGPMTVEQAQAVREALTELFQSAEWKEEILTTLPDEPQIRTAIEAWLQNALEEMLQRGAREVFAEQVGAEVETSLKKFTHQLVAEHVLRKKVEETAREILPVADARIVSELCSRIKLENCPGTWLRFAVYQELQTARTTWEPGASYDLLHLTHLPYVAVFFADAEITENTKKVLRRDNTPAFISRCRPPVAAGNSLQAMANILFGDGASQ